MTLDVVVLGAGGHARVVADALNASGRKVLGFLDRSAGKHGTTVLGLPVLGGDEVLRTLSPESVELANGVGSAGTMDARFAVYSAAVALGFRFCTIVHPDATIAASARLGSGCQVMARAVVQPLATIGENSIINTAAVVEHDAVVGAHVHVSPGCILAGEVRVADRVHVGVGAMVIQQVRVGEGSFIAAGAVVVSEVAPGARVMGVPARVQA